MRKYCWVFYFTTLFIVAFGSCQKEALDVIEFEVNQFDPVAINKNNDQVVFMHYMPWFETKESSGNNRWGIHWTMANMNPDNVDASGKREIASNYYPLIGPYHSGDDNVIEYHLLLMKHAGIDGVLIDWYGSFDLNDYAANRENSEALINLIDKVGLKFAIVYEDRTLDDVVNAGLSASMENAAKADMQYLQRNYFSNPNYYYVDNKPLLLVFGPDQLTSESNWTSAFSVLTTKPTFLTLSSMGHKAGQNAQGEFAWVFDGDETKEDDFYNSLANFQFSMGSAYPGFHDFYKQGGWGENFFFLDHNEGATFDSKLKKVKDSGVNMVQMITWNDFGEGTMLEPTTEFGFSALQKIKEFTEVSDSKDVFENIYGLYKARLEYKDNLKIQKKLDQVFYYFVSMQTEKALMELNDIGK